MQPCLFEKVLLEVVRVSRLSTTSNAMPQEIVGQNEQSFHRTVLTRLATVEFPQ